MFGSARSRCYQRTKLNGPKPKEGEETSQYYHHSKQRHVTSWHEKFTQSAKKLYSLCQIPNTSIVFISYSLFI